VEATRRETVGYLAERENRFIDKRTWGDGPWQNEPDHVQWQDPATDLVCLAVRVPWAGQWCGYVGVPEGHPAFGLNYEEVDKLGPRHKDAEGYEWGGLRVHGGLTFADFCQEGEEGTGICHVPQPGQPERVYWLGFDMAHAGDIMPGMDAQLRAIGHEPIRYAPIWGDDDEYRTLEYVQAECAHLADQLAKVDEMPGHRPDRHSSAG
jgi:hypothetical protein